MTASKQIKGLLAGVAALAFVATAMAQGSPPNPAVKNAPMGAGQQSSQQTPMGTTGTPAGGATTGSGSTANSGSTGTGSTTGSGSTSSMGSTGSTSGTSMGAGSASTDTTMASSTGSTRKADRRARADRN